jgi:hypothetical protein
MAVMQGQGNDWLRGLAQQYAQQREAANRAAVPTQSGITPDGRPIVTYTPPPATGLFGMPMPFQRAATPITTPIGTMPMPMNPDGTPTGGPGLPPAPALPAGAAVPAPAVGQAPVPAPVGVASNGPARGLPPEAVPFMRQPPGMGGGGITGPGFNPQAFMQGGGAGGAMPTNGNTGVVPPGMQHGGPPGGAQGGMGGWAGPLGHGQERGSQEHRGHGLWGGHHRFFQPGWTNRMGGAFGGGQEQGQRQGWGQGQPQTQRQAAPAGFAATNPAGGVTGEPKNPAADDDEDDEDV